MKALIEKKVAIEPYSPNEDINGKMIKKTITIYLFGIPVYFSIASLLR